MGIALIDGRQETVLIDSGARANAIMPEYCVKHELKVRPVCKLAMSPTSIPVSGIGGMTSHTRLRHHQRADTRRPKLQ